MAYQVKEIFYTLQGEGFHTGRPAVFCRFSGCNLWTGREQDRETATCNFCDTNFRGTDGPGGGWFAGPVDLVRAIVNHWPSPSHGGIPFVVLTGGEPLLQVDQALVDTLHQAGFEIALETNGTRIPPMGIDWITVSPKSPTNLVLQEGNELKLVYPLPGMDPELFGSLPFRYFYLQPLDDPGKVENTRQAVGYCMRNPKWRLSLQTHKILGIP